MKRFLKFFISFLILGAISYQFRDNIWTSVPCAKPITYTIGAFDTQFNISQKYFLSALSDAEIIWEKPFGKELFTYMPDTGVLKINLIYDFRQQATNKLASMGIVVKEDKASYDLLKLKFNNLNTQFITAKNDYENRIVSFNKKQQAYEQQVKYWNTHGGVSKKEYDTFQAEKSILDLEASQLQFLQTQINEMVDEINALVVVLNRLVITLNLSVDQYNIVNSARGESFEEGVYKSDGINMEIDIYEFSSREKLVRVLAHELGHALGLDHVDDSKAIMYKFNQDNNEILTEADFTALKTKCGVK